MSSCFGFRKSQADDRQPLLPQYHDDTSLQRQLHQKLHSYQMIRALSKGYMPSNEQAIINLRTLLAADILNPDNPDLSDSGRLLVKYTKQWLYEFIELLQHKNSEDQIQDFIWFLSKSKVSVDVEDIASRASKAKVKADTVAAYRSLQTVGSLLLTNSDFRLFLSDLNTIGREVFKDTAFTLSDVAKDAGKRIEPSQEEQQALKEPGADAAARPSADELNGELSGVADVVSNGAVKVVKEAEQSLAEKLTGDEKESLLYRLKQVVLNLRKRTDYSDSVSTISLLLKRYAMTYSRAVEDTISTAQDDVNPNHAMNRAVKNFWTFLSSFGKREEWDKLKQIFERVMDHRQRDPEFEDFMMDIGNSMQKLLTDPDFFDHADEKFKELREKSRGLGSDSSLRQDVDEFFGQIHATFKSVVHDKDVAKLMTTSSRIFKILSPAHTYTNGELVTDAINVFVPLLVQAIQYIPIPRLEVATPDIDLLLENLIIEPGRTVNHSSFLPYRLRVETYNDLEIRKARFRTASRVTSLVTIKIDGLSMRADEIGFLLRAHSGLLRLADEGIASFHLDERGIDIHLDVEIGKERLEKMVTLRAVRVHIHKLTYKIRKSKFSFIGWLFKPLLRPIIRKVMEKQLASAIADGLHAANRELLFARERLRATRISDPDDIRTFFKALMARLTPEDDPDLYTRVGIAQPGKGVFKGKYAPGSIVKLWNEEATRAGERVDDYDQGGWRNEVFNVHTTYMT
ncbi:bactericidal permeability-increasing protein [Glonium stellatum]|uniref:Bactericidal permeability-increasing protein n=1 Tax=Glonium stellatum TaxID=574774 RepID=A0A8E2EZ94_9PEZI|nr:bactericidal permeability-increasing protein [Glonium stellatum]